MYFGLLRISQLPFVPIGIGVVLAWSLLLVLVFAVGASKGAYAALRYFRIVVWGGALVLALIWLWAVLSGQWATFMRLFGWEPMAEMLVLAGLYVFTFVWMAMRYVGDKVRAAQTAAPDAGESVGGSHA